MQARVLLGGIYLFVIYTLPAFTKGLELADNKRHIDNKIVIYVGMEDQKSEGKGERKRDVCSVSLLIKAIESYVFIPPLPRPQAHYFVLKRRHASHPSQK